MLKNYVDRTASPDFKLGAALAASDFLAHGQVYALAASNFDEMTAGNDMKYASIVGNDGTMSFDNVRNFVNGAAEAGMTVYGHTLAWHAQQNNKYLNSLIADKEIEVDPNEMSEVLVTDHSYPTDGPFPYYAMGCEPPIVNGAIHFEPADPTGWYQFFILPGASNSLTKGDYVVYLEMASDKDASGVQLTLQNGWGESDQSITVLVPVVAGEQVYKLNVPGIEGGNYDVILKPQTAGAVLDVRSIKLYRMEAAAVSWWTDVVSNGDAEGGASANFVSTHVGGTNGPADIVDGAGMDGTRAFVVTSAGGGTNTWDTQFFVYADRPFAEGDKIKLAFDYRADVANNAESQAHAAPGGYIHWDGGAAISFTTEWQHFEKTIVVNSTVSPEGNFQTFAWNLDVGAPEAPVNKYYFDNVTFAIEESGNTIPLTPEEKKDTLTWAMDNWIKGMMEVTAGKVSAWDAVNEAISGADTDGDGWYDLQHGSDANNFFWQDYLGDEDYVRLVIAKARQYYAEFGGTDPLRLFINDYNLESDWDDNKKLKSLIHWIEVWESDGETVIDGIATQMHVSCYADETTQKSKEEHVVKMLQLMAATGKLVKISELDMGYVDADGQTVPTSSMTEEQHKAMAAYYKFIVSKYFEIIPAAQQYGITQWCLTDASGELGTGWRGGEPVGLWDMNYNRKHTYAGFVEGLKGN
nr:endo-1,4-beta-xylanase [uncultured bacterium]